MALSISDSIGTQCRTQLAASCNVQTASFFRNKTTGTARTSIVDHFEQHIDILDDQ
jgi:hypothetical protein